MHCPSCGLYHPTHYTTCVSCGAQLRPDNQESVRVPVRAAQKHPSRYQQLSPAVGISIAVGIVVIAAAVTLFLLRPSNEHVLYEKAQKELSSGQYAFAAKLLEQLTAANPNDAKVYLALARAYVGIDQTDRAWGAIARAQQLGAGVIADPALTYQLANYYRQQGSYERAAQLLRPLAATNTGNARAELSDLDAAWGDGQIDSNVEQAMRCWEEVQSLNTGSRVQEAPAKLATIYQRYADKLTAEGDDKAALSILKKLNMVAQNPFYHQKTADVYEKLGFYDQACDQLRTAISLAGPQSDLNIRLAALLAKYGKQLLDSGDTQKGYDCLQQASDLDKNITVPSLVLKDVSVDVNPVDRHAQMWASVLNAGQTPVSHVKVDAKLVSLATGRILWQGSQSIIGEYDPPFAPQAREEIKFNSTATVKSDGSTAFNIDINNQFYKSYQLGKKSDDKHTKTVRTNEPSATASSPSPTVSSKTESTNHITPESQILKDLER
jgi:tetratricopeptide (TPR) repeat protein